MNARILTAATFAVTFAMTLPGKAADPQLLNLVMPDAAVIAGVNVEQAKTSPFGQYILSQIPTQDRHMQELTAQTGFDPTRDVRELLAASTAAAASTKQPSGLILARGAFDISRITSVANEHGVVTENYKGVSILSDPKHESGVAFLNATLVVAGDVASVKGAIDRQSSPTTLPAALLTQINQWSTTQDAWAISLVAPSALHTSADVKQIPGMNGQGAFQTIQSGAGGVKLGNQVVITGQALSDNAADAKTIADSIKLLASLAQLQAQKEPALAGLAQSLQVSSTGSTVNVSLSIPEELIQQVVKPKAAVNRQLQPRRKQ